jgi:competence protein ComEC
MNLLKLLAVLLVSCPIADEFRPFAIVWNIGQGQWVTVVTNSTCLHFDMGGERTLPPVLHYCFERKNRVYLSHGDLDHIKFLPWGEHHLPQLCDAAPPLDKINQRKQSMVAQVPICHYEITTGEVKVVEITPPIDEKSSGHNELSRVFVVEGPNHSILIPGDSTADAEKVWAKKLRSLPPIQILVAGHHGSRTSTSADLLNALPQLEVVIASARKSRYGHPHPEVVSRLHSRHVPLFSTEQWGSIAVQL